MRKGYTVSMDCWNCGQVIPADLKYCRTCGTPVKLMEPAGDQIIQRSTVIQGRTVQLSSTTNNYSAVEGPNWDQHLFIRAGQPSKTPIRPTQRAHLTKTVTLERGALVEASVFAPAALTIGDHAVINGDVYAGGPLVVGEASTLKGNVFAAGSVTLEQGARVDGTLIAIGQTASVGAQSRLRRMVAKGDVTLGEEVRLDELRVGGRLHLPRRAIVARQSAVIAQDITGPPGFALTLAGGVAGQEHVFAWTGEEIVGIGSTDGIRRIISCVLSREVHARAVAAQSRRSSPR